MARYLLYLCICIPFFAAAQDRSQPYVHQKMEEAKDLYWKSDYSNAIKILDELYAHSVKTHNRYGIAIASIRKIYYEIDAGNLTTAPDWGKLEELVNKNTAHRNYLNMELLRVKGIYYSILKDGLPTALRYFEEGIEQAGISPKKSFILGELYYNYAQALDKKSDRVTAAKYFWKAIHTFEALHHDQELEPVYGDLANCYFLMGEKEKGIEMAKKNISLSKANGNYENLGILLGNLARMYQLSGVIDSALQYFEESFLYTNQSFRKENRFVALADMAFLYHSKKDRPHALKYMEEAITLGREMKRSELHRYIRVAAMFAGYTGNEKLMQQYYDESHAMALAARDKDGLRDWNGSLAHYYAAVKKDTSKAYPYLTAFHAYKDSIINEKSKKDFHELEVLYETEKKQAAIEQLATREKIQQLEIEKKNALLKGNLVEAAQKEKEIQLLTQDKIINNLKIEQQAKSLSLSNATVKSLQQQKKIAEQENLLNQQKINNEKLNRNFILALLAAAVIGFSFILNRIQLKKKIEQKNILLKERNRISAELHDEVGSTLTAINILSHSAIHQLKAVNAAEPQSKVERIKENTQAVMDNISDIVWSMNPDNDSFPQIIIRMKEYAGNVLEPQNIQYQFNVEENLEDIKLSPEKRRNFYLIFKEGMNNLAKYAKANHAHIGISKTGKAIELSIQDNGTGFDERTVKHGNGIKNMKTRTERNKGKFGIRSGQTGTTITVLLPYA